MSSNNKDNYKYVDDRGNVHFISKKGLDLAVKYKLELQKINGRANWNLLCRWLKKDGYNVKKCEAFRLLVRNYQRSQGKLPSKKSEELLKKSAESNVSAYEGHLGELALDTRNEQNTRRELNKLKRRLLDERLTDREVNSTIKKALGDARFHLTIANNLSLAVEPKRDGTAMVICLSDWHIGSRFSGSDYKFNYDILVDCVKEYLGKIKHAITVRQPDNIYVVSLGDLIENLYMRKQDQAFESEFDLATQETKIIELLSWFLGEIAVYTKANVYYTGIAGNHDRSNGNYRNNVYGDSFNKVLGAVINLLSQSVPNLTYIKPDNAYRTHLTINGINIKIIHGDIDNIHDPSIIAKLGQRDNRLYQVLLLGHEHHYEIKEQNGLFFMVGSLKGADSYSDKLSLHAGRSQGFLWIGANGEIEPEVVRIYTK